MTKENKEFDVYVNTLIELNSNMEKIIDLLSSINSKLDFDNSHEINNSSIKKKVTGWLNSLKSIFLLYFLYLLK